MGVSDSRSRSLPDGIDDPKFKTQIMASWTKENALACSHNKLQGKQQSTLLPQTLELATKYLCEYFERYPLKNINVLEIMAGNCVASFYVMTAFLRANLIKNNQPSWLSTDICTYSSRLANVPFLELNSVDAVEKKGKDANILLLISAPPYSVSSFDDEKLHGYGDYYAIKTFIDMTKPSEKKYIIIIGELGASDGSEGMYLYMTDHKNLVLEKRVLLTPNMISPFGDPLEKELFIFQIKKD